MLLTDQGILKVIDFGLAREIRSRPPYTDYVSTRWYRVILIPPSSSGPRDHPQAAQLQQSRRHLRPRVHHVRTLHEQAHLPRTERNGSAQQDRLRPRVLHSLIPPLAPSPSRIGPKVSSSSPKEAWSYPNTPLSPWTKSYATPATMPSTSSNPCSNGTPTRESQPHKSSSIPTSMTPPPSSQEKSQA